MAKRRITWRGRTLVAVSLASFLVVASSIVWRRSRGNEVARRLAQLGTQEADLQSERARLEGEIHELSSLGKLQPVVARLGMHVPNDSQVILLPRPKER